MKRYTHLHTSLKVVTTIEDDAGEFVLTSDVKRKLENVSHNLKRSMDSIHQAQRQPHGSLHHENIELRLAIRKAYDDVNNLLRGVK